MGCAIPSSASATPRGLVMASATPTAGFQSAAGMPMQSLPSSNAASKPEVFVLVQTRIFRSVCDVQNQDEYASVVGMYSSFRAAKVALRNKLAHFHLPRGDEQFYFGMRRGQSEDHEGWPDLEEADEETVHHFMNDHAALLAGEPGAEDRFKLVDESDSYAGFLVDGEGNVEGMVVDMEDGTHPFKWDESWCEGRCGHVSPPTGKTTRSQPKAWRRTRSKSKRQRCRLKSCSGGGGGGGGGTYVRSSLDQLGEHRLHEPRHNTTNQYLDQACWIGHTPELIC